MKLCLFVQKSSTIRFLIFFMISFLLSISSFDTFSSPSFSCCCGCTLSWIPSSCSTIFITFLFCDYSYSNIFFLYSSFFLRIFSRCSNKRFFLYQADYVFKSYFCYYWGGFYGDGSSTWAYIGEVYFFDMPFMGGRSDRVFVAGETIGYRGLVFVILDFFQFYIRNYYA